MRILAFFSILLTLAAFTIGCDWTSGGGVDSWNSRWNWANFSGVYRGVNGGILVTDFTATPGTPGSTNAAAQTIAVTDGVSSSFNGILSKKPVVPGSVSVTVAGVSFSDDGAGSLVGGNGGTIDYGTGAVSVSLNFNPPPGENVVVTYSHTISGTEGTGSAGPGSTSVQIRSFTVHQEGETLRVTDNNGATYVGNMGGVRSSGGFSGEGVPPIGETIVAQYAVKGVSASGLEVELVGTFQGVVGGAESGNFFLTNRLMLGTWIENGGRTGDINGQASPIPVTFTETEGGE